MQSATLTLPVPPLPLSQCFANKRHGRYATPQYLDWQQIVDTHLLKMHAYALGLPKRPAIPGDVKVNVIVRRPDKRRRDIDNICKASLDTLVRNFVIADDSRIVDLHLRWAEELQHAAVIEIERVPLIAKAT